MTRKDPIDQNTSEDVANISQVNDTIQTDQKTRETLKEKPLTLLEHRFTKAYVYRTSGNGVKAYLLADKNVSYGSAATAAYELLKRPEIIAVIQRLQAAIDYTAEDALRECNVLYKKGLKWKQGSSVGKAIELKCKVKGLITDKVEQTSRIIERTQANKALTPAELQEQLIKGLRNKQSKVEQTVSN